MAIAAGRAYFGPFSALDPSRDHTEPMRQAKTAIVRELSRSTTYWIGLLQEATHAGSHSALPATMLRRVDFDVTPDDRVVRVKFHAVEEPPDLAW
jgi:hypothetical protein